MQGLLRHTVIWFLITNLMVATMGLTVHTLYCLCKGEQEVSLFEISETCKASSGRMSESFSCCSKSGCYDPQVSSDYHNCGKKDKKFVKLESSFTVKESKQVYDFVPPFVPAVAISWISFPVREASTAQIFNKAPPEKASGRQLLTLFQSFLC